MKTRAIQPLAAVPLALAGTALLASTSAMTPAHGLGRNAVVAQPVLLSGETETFAAIGTPPDPGQGVMLMMGGSGVPIPPVDVAQWAFDHYANANAAALGDYVPQIMFTPEGAQPAFGGIKSLPFDTSVAQGVAIVESKIAAAIRAGHPVAVGGVSQSSTINSQVLQDIADGKFVLPDTSGLPPGVTPLQFISLGNPSNPNGGFLERFNLPQDPTPTIPSIELTFSGAAPADTDIPVFSYCLEYDPNCDFPLYTQNLVSDLNAMAGWALVHPQYIEGVVAPGVGVDPGQITGAIELPTSPGYDGGTTYYMMPWEGQLPLATVIELIAGKPIADLLEPVLKVLANLGYGMDPEIGWSTLPADVPTPLQVSPIPDWAQFQTILGALMTGAEQGFKNFVADLTNPSDDSGDTALAGLLGGGGDPTGPHSFLDAVNGFSGALAQLYSLALPVADIVNALGITLPANQFEVAMNSLQDGDLMGALQLPGALATGLEALAGGFLVMVGLQALPNIADDLSVIF